MGIPLIKITAPDRILDTVATGLIYYWATLLLGTLATGLIYYWATTTYHLEKWTNLLLGALTTGQVYYWPNLLLD